MPELARPCPLHLSHVRQIHHRGDVATAPWLPPAGHARLGPAAAGAPHGALPGRPARLRGGEAGHLCPSSFCVPTASLCLPLLLLLCCCLQVPPALLTCTQPSHPHSVSAGPVQRHSVPGCQGRAPVPQPAPAAHDQAQLPFILQGALGLWLGPGLGLVPGRWGADKWPRPTGLIAADIFSPASRFRTSTSWTRRPGRTWSRCSCRRGAGRRGSAAGSTSTTSSPTTASSCSSTCPG